MKTLWIAAVIVVAGCIAMPSAQRDDSVPYQADRTIQHWHLIVNETFEALKAYTSDEFVDEVNELIDQFLAIGAVRAAQDKANDQQMKAADDAVKRFATAMVAAGTRQPDGVIQVTDESVRAGVRKICPQYPFCK